MKYRRIFKWTLLLGFMLTSQYALSAPMEGADNNSGSIGQTEEVKFPTTSTKGGSKNTKSTNKTNKETSSNILPIISLLVGLSGAGVAIMAILKGNKLEEENKQLKAVFAKHKELMKVEIANLNNSIVNLKQQLSDTRIDLNRTVALQRSTNSSHICMSDTRTYEAATADRVIPQPQSRPQVSTPFKEYFGIPNQSLFISPSTNYVTGKTLYCVQGTAAENTAEFSYIDNAETASIAARSITRFVEVGCIVRGEIRNNFSKVITIKPGKVIKAGSGWRIESKAIVELK